MAKIIGYALDEGADGYHLFPPDVIKNGNGKGYVSVDRVWLWGGCVYLTKPEGFGGPRPDWWTKLDPVRTLESMGYRLRDAYFEVVKTKQGVNLSKPSIATSIPFEAFLGGHIDCFSLMPYYQHANGKFYDRIAIGPSASGKTGVMFYSAHDRAVSLVTDMSKMEFLDSIGYGKIVYKSHFIKNAWEKEK